MPSKPQTAIHIPPTHPTTTPPESFPASPSIPHSNCTWHTLISSPLTPSTSLSAGIAVLPPKSGNLCPHRHQQAEIYYVISGRAVVTVNGEDFELREGSTFWVPGDAEHGVVNQGTEAFRWFYVFAAEGFGDVTYRWSEKGGVKARL